MPMPNKPSCRADKLFGLWLCEPEQLASLRDTVWIVIEQNRIEAVAEASQEMRGEDPVKKMVTFQDGMARISMSGPLTKHPTSFQSLVGGTSMVLADAAIRMAAKTPGVKGIFIDADSPGGTADGTADLAHTIRRVAQQIPIFFHGQDLACSGMLWLATQGVRFTGGPTASIGSQGVKAVLWERKLPENSLKRPIVVTTGKWKALGEEGLPITDEQVAEIQRLVNGVNGPFQKDVFTARKLSEAQQTEVGTARIFIGEGAKTAGLIDAVCSTEEAFEEAKRITGNGRSPAPNNPSLAARSKKMPLNDQQLQTARQLTGATNLTVENADELLLTAASKLHLENEQLRPNVRKMVDPELLKGRAEIMDGKLDLLVGAGNITAAQKDMLRKVYMNGDTPIMEMLSPAGNGKLVCEGVIEAMKLNKPNGIQGETTGAQPAQRQVPGGTGGSNGDVPKASLERTNYVRAQNNLPPIGADGKIATQYVWNPVPHEVFAEGEGTK